MARLFADENFPRQAVTALRALGHDIQTATEAGLANRQVSDADVLVYASREQRAVLTLNRRDFIALHNASADHAGIVVCTQDPDTVRQARQIDEALRSISVMHGLLIRINRPQA